MISAIVLVLLAVVTGAVRLLGVKTALYQALAHVYVGGLFGAAFVGKRRWLYLVLAIGLTVLEVGAFLYFQSHP